MSNGCVYEVERKKTVREIVSVALMWAWEGEREREEKVKIEIQRAHKERRQGIDYLLHPAEKYCYEKKINYPKIRKKRWPLIRRQS